MSTKNSNTEEEILDLVHTVMHRYRSQQYEVLREGSHDVTHMESKVLNYFAKHPGATLSDLSVCMGRDKAQLTRLIKSLRERGLIDGKTDDTDRRSVTLVLTLDGQSVLRSLRTQAKRLNTRAVGGFSVSEQTLLRELLARVKENLSSD
jgi:DNA-binding MarR family transcriptional regulator